MHAPFKFLAQRFHDQTVLRETAQAVKMAGRDSDPEMGLPALFMAGMVMLAPTPGMVMAVMLPAFVDDFDEGGLETGGEFVDNGLANVHTVWLLVVRDD